MYQVCICTCPHLTGSDPHCPIHGQPPEFKTYSYCESCASLAAMVKELEEEIETTFNKAQDLMVVIGKQELRLAALEKVAEAAQKVGELTHDGDMLPLDGIWFDAMKELCAALKEVGK